MNHYETGKDALSRMLGNERAKAISSRFCGLSPAFEQEAISVVFGRTWSRGGLDTKTRALCTIGILAATGRQNALNIVFELALRNGATQDEINETLLQTAAYVGYPAALDALIVLEGVLQQINAPAAK